MKKILTILLFFVSFVHAEQYLYVDSPEFVNSLYNVINSTVVLLGSDEYEKLLRLAFLLGGFFIFLGVIAGTFKDGGKDGLFKLGKYWLTSVAILTIVFSAKDTVVIKSKNFPQYYESNATSTTMGTAVDNVPEVLAFGYKVVNSIQNSLTDLYESAFNVKTVNDNGYASDSLRDAMSLLSLRFENGDSTLGNAMYTLIGECILIPFSAKGEEGRSRIEEIEKSKNIKNTLDDWYNNDIVVGGIKVSEYQAEYSGEIWKCGDLWKYISDSKLQNFADREASVALKTLDSRDMKLITGIDDMPKSNFDEYVIQAGMVNSLIDNKNLLNGSAYANGKTQAERVLEGITMGEYVKDTIGSTQEVFMIFLYAAFPLLLVVSFFSFSVLKNYAMSLIWISAWGVSVTILNGIVSYQTIEIMKEIAADGKIDSYSSIALLTEAAKYVGVAGALYASVPAITWLLIKGSATMLEGIGSQMAAGVTRNMRTEAVAGDSKKMSMKQAASEKAGKDLSFAEALHYRENFAGMKEGVALGVDINQGEVGVKELADYSAQKPYSDFVAKKDAMKSLGYSMPTAGLLANTEGAISGGSLAKGLGDLKQTGGTKRMYDRGRMGAAGELGKLDEIGVGGTYKVSRGSAAKSKGEVDVAGIDGMRGAGRYAGRTDKAHAALEKKHGAGLTSAAFYQGNENTIRQNVRGGMLGDDYHASSEAQRITTEELPNYNKYDFNGDGTVSPSEAALGGQINTLDGKMGIAGKKAKQDQLKAEAEKNRSSASPAVRDAQTAGEGLYNDPNAAAIGAAAVKGGVGTRTDSANTRKDSKVLDQLKDNDTNMEDTAVLDSKRMLGDFGSDKNTNRYNRRSNQRLSAKEKRN